MSNLQERLKDLSPAKRALLEQMLLERASQQSTTNTIPKRPVDAPNTLSRAEQRLWFVDQLEREHPFYNMPLAARLTGPLCKSAFESAVQQIVQRHETLRTTYSLVDGQPKRNVHDLVEIQPTWIDVSSADDPQTEVRNQMKSAGREPFNLERGPLLRVIVYRLAQDDHIVLLVMHHIISDGWSMMVMMRELTELYGANVAGKQSTLETLAIQYSDFAHWQDSQLTEQHIESQLEYWRKQLADVPEALDLPTDHPRPAIQDFDGETVPIQFSSELTANVNALARNHGTTPFVVLLAAQALLLGRYSRQDDLVLGTASAGRIHPEVESQIGFFVNTLALRVKLEDISFSDLIKQVADTFVDAQEHADVPFERLVDEFAAGRDRSYSPIFQSALVMQNLNRDFRGAQGMTVQPMMVDNGTAKYDLTFFLWEEDERLIGHVEFRTTLFQRATAVRLAQCLESLLIAATENSDALIHRLPIMPKSQREQVTIEFNQTDTDTIGPETLHELFLAHVKNEPQKTAVVHGSEQISYGELNVISDRIAAHLIQRGVKRETAVVVSLNRSIDLFATVLGICKAGGSFVLVDPEYPQGRVAFIYAETKALMLVDEKLVDELKSPTDIVALPTVAATDRAYVVFTSGSTGSAKGVQIEHRSIVNFIHGQVERMGVTPNDRTSFSFSPAFDGAISEIFYAIGSGACSVIIDADVIRDPKRLTDYINKNKITVCKFPPSLLSMLDEKQLRNVRTMASAGDKLTGELAKRWIDGGRRFFNGYGPTEVSVGCSMMELTGDDMSRPPIGTPMRNMRMYVLDDGRQPVPVGAKGEIYVGGIGVARGYLNRQDLNAQSFLPDPFSNRPNARMYRTGDLGRWLPTGVLEFVGRADDQVSLRGFRVEPGEIAAALEELDDVRQALVMQRNDSGADQLVAYVVPESDAKVLNAADSLESDHVRGWKELFEQTHRAAPPALDASFNVTGWVSTYTGKPIPRFEMRDWTDSTVDRILSLEPKKVLEIGCGTGLLLLRLIDHCDSYVGTDLFQASLNNVEKALQSRPSAQNKVTLHQQLADQFDKLDDEKFDTIILNSVVQYFPSTGYLVRVLQGAIERLAPGGTIFLGDIRNHRLQNALATSIELFNADDSLSLEKLQEQIALRIEHEEELLLDPSMFSELASKCPRITAADVQLKNARQMNELSRFRYDVVLRTKPMPAIQHIEKEFAANLTPEELLQQIGDTELPSLKILGVKNPRVAADLAASELLRANKAQSTRQLKSLVVDGVEPNDYYDLETKLPIKVDIAWSETTHDMYDVTITPLDVLKNTITAEATQSTSSRPIQLDSNDPLASRRNQQMTKHLREQLRDRLPNYMIPSALVVLDKFPVTVNGKVDRNALPAPVGRPAWAGDLIAPTTETEKAITQIWEDLLDVRPIGINDDFFDLGGHSMLAVRMISEVDNALGQQLPLQALFQESTVAHLAKLIDHPELFQAASTIVPLKQSNTGTPLFCVHPAGGTVFCYMELVKHLAADRPVFGLQAQGIDGNAQPHDSLVEMATHYAKAIRESHPNGPVHIAGWSLGGNIAFEVARQLQASGGEVGVVALLDSGLLSPDTELKEEDFLPLLMALFPGAMNVSLDELREKDRDDQLQFFIERATVAGIVPEEEFDKAGNIFGVFQSNVKAVHQYVAGSFDGDVHLFRPADQSKTNNLFDDPVLGWQDVTRDVHIIEVPGDHAHMLQSPAAEVLAKKLDEAMSGNLVPSI